MELLKPVGRGGLIGLLLGFAFVSWVNPGTPEGQMLLLLICVLIGVALSLIVAVLRGMFTRKTPPPGGAQDGEARGGK